MGRWIFVCLAIGCSHHDNVPVDAAVVDAAVEPCNGDTCVAGSDFCYLQSVGAFDVVSPPNIGCNSLPPSCASNPTCACVLPTLPSCGGALSCTDDDGVPNVLCAFP